MLCLIPAQKGQRLQLFHYTADKLCCWQPNSRTIESLPCLCTVVENSIPELHDHFGKSEHGYGHWLKIPLVEGEFSLWQMLIEFPEAADPSMRDAAPLRLGSWLRCHLSENAQTLIDETMTGFSKVEPVHSDKILHMGGFHLPHVADKLHTWDNMRDATIDEITLKGIVNPPQIVVNLIRGFLQRLPLPRLIHLLILFCRKWFRSVLPVLKDYLPREPARSSPVDRTSRRP